MGKQDSKYVIQFKDGTFLRHGEFYGLLSIVGEVTEAGRTNTLDDARMFFLKEQAQSMAKEMGIKESYEIKEVEVKMILK
ncbi:hypothetical protein [Bacillus sp. FJAT-44742]|uniref:hypothetical protein n=1 Tax=Bacillus sp. FJAT-44742 TaxID=2014005 RepID=UPI000C245313|nr:hypothetical protein [Bacillus sp. FJAT-44742]